MTSALGRAAAVTRESAQSCLCVLESIGLCHETCLCATQRRLPFLAHRFAGDDSSVELHIDAINRLLFVTVELYAQRRSLTAAPRAARLLLVGAVTDVRTDQYCAGY